MAGEAGNALPASSGATRHSWVMAAKAGALGGALAMVGRVLELPLVWWVGIAVAALPLGRVLRRVGRGPRDAVHVGAAGMTVSPAAVLIVGVAALNRELDGARGWHDSVAVLAFEAAVFWAAFLFSGSFWRAGRTPALVASAVGLVGFGLGGLPQRMRHTAATGGWTLEPIDPWDTARALVWWPLLALTLLRMMAVWAASFAPGHAGRSESDPRQ